jgi:hypothetical protein
MAMTKERETQNPKLITDMKSRVRDILIVVSWREIANNYFGKSSSWLYHKLDAIDGNGGVGGFTEQEAEQFKEALRDLARRINKCADEI